MVDSAGAFESERREIAALFDVLRSAPPGRVYAGLGGNWGQRYRVGSVPMYALVTNSGFDTLGYLYHTLSLNSDLQVLFDERRPEQYNLFNVRYVVAPVDQPFPDFVVPWQSFGRHRLYRVTTSGYFDLVRSDKTLAAERHDFYLGGSRWLASDLPSLAVHPRLLFGRAARDLPAVPRFSQVTEVIPTSSIGPEPPLGRILLEELTLDSYTVEIEVERPATLMFKGTYHPNWQIYFHNKPVEPSAIAPSFVGILLIPGEHTIRLEYRSGPLRSLLMLVGIVVLAAIVVAERPGWFWHRRRAPDDRRLDPDAEDDQGLLRIRM